MQGDENMGTRTYHDGDEDERLGDVGQQQRKLQTVVAVMESVRHEQEERDTGRRPAASVALSKSDPSRSDEPARGRGRAHSSGRSEIDQAIAID